MSQQTLPLIDRIVDASHDRPTCKSKGCDNKTERMTSGNYRDECNTCRRAAPVVRRVVAEKDALIKVMQVRIKGLEDAVNVRAKNLRDTEASMRIVARDKAALQNMLRAKDQEIERLSNACRGAETRAMEGADLENKVAGLKAEVVLLNKEKRRLIARHDEAVERSRSLAARNSQLSIDFDESQRLADRLKSNAPARWGGRIKSLEAEVDRLDSLVERKEKVSAHWQRCYNEECRVSYERAKKIGELENEVARKHEIPAYVTDLIKERDTWKAKATFEGETVTELTNDLAIQRTLNTENVNEYTERINELEADHKEDFDRAFWAAVVGWCGLLAMALKLWAVYGG